MSFPTTGALSNRALRSGASYDIEFRELKTRICPRGAEQFHKGVDLNGRATWHLILRIVINLHCLPRKRKLFTDFTISIIDAGLRAPTPSI
jgi:hypothetical protein